jgi:hypothetical protein
MALIPLIFFCIGIGIGLVLSVIGLILTIIYGTTVGAALIVILTIVFLVLMLIFGIILARHAKHGC